METDIVSGKKAYSQGKLRSGQIEDQGSFSKTLAASETLTLPAGIYSSITVKAPKTNGTVSFQNIYQKEISKKDSGKDNGSGTFTWTVPEGKSGYLVYNIQNGHDHWDYADDTYGGDVSMTLTCDTPSGTMVNAGDVLTFHWVYKWYKGKGIWDCSATAYCYISIMY